MWWACGGLYFFILFSLSHLWGADTISFHPPRKVGKKWVPQKGWCWPWDRFIRLASRLLLSVVSWSFHQQLHQRRQGVQLWGRGKEWTEEGPPPCPASIHVGSVLPASRRRPAILPSLHQQRGQRAEAWRRWLRAPCALAPIHHLSSSRTEFPHK